MGPLNATVPLMGTDVAPRKEFIVQGAYEVDADAIDA